MFQIDPSMDKSEQTALLLSMMIQIGRSLDDLGETDAAIMMAEASVLVASHQVPKNEQEREDLEKIQDGLRTVTRLLYKQKENKPTLQ